MAEQKTIKNESIEGDKECCPRCIKNGIYFTKDIGLVSKTLDYICQKEYGTTEVFCCKNCKTSVEWTLNRYLIFLEDKQIYELFDT